jgi:hypothetical protein
MEASTNLKCEGDFEVNWSKDLEQLLGSAFMSAERSFVLDCSTTDWSNLSMLARTNAVNLLCEYAMESEALRTVLAAAAGEDKIKPPKVCFWACFPELLLPMCRLAVVAD